MQRARPKLVQQHFDGKLIWTGKGDWNGNSIYVGNNTVIKLVKAGKVTINWFGGYGEDADAEITYDAEGKATITIIHSDKYIVDITVNTAVIPEASVNRTLSVYVVGDESDTLLTTITKPHGNVINKAAISALITADNYPGKMLDKVYAGDKTTEYDYSAITGDTNIYVSLKDSSKTWQAGENISLSFGGGVKPVVAGVEFSSQIVGNGSECRTNFGQTIKITAAAGTTAKINWHPNGSPTDNNADIKYVDGQIVITLKAPETGEEGNFNDGTLYIRSIDIVAAE